MSILIVNQEDTINKQFPVGYPLIRDAYIADIDTVNEFYLLKLYKEIDNNSTTGSDGIKKLTKKYFQGLHTYLWKTLASQMQASIRNGTLITNKEEFEKSLEKMTKEIEDLIHNQLN